MPPVQAPGPFSFLENMTLSKADVALLKTTADTFAASYTSGADAAKDKAALSAADTGMQTLFANIWSETHVVSKDALTKLQQSVDSFVAAYTAGKNVTQDSSAWSALQSGLNDFWTSVGTAGATTPPLPMPMPMPLPIMAMPMTLAAASVTGSGAGTIAPATGFVTGSDAVMLTPSATSISGSGAGMIASGAASPDFMLAQPKISKTDVTKLQQAVDAFAASYTSGTDPAVDKTAVSFLESSLSSLVQNWQPSVPAPSPTPMPVQTTPSPSPSAPPAGTVSTMPASTAAAPASTVSTVPAGTPVNSPAPPGPILPNLPPRAFVAMPISTLTRWIPGIGRPLGAPVVVGR
jgi:hypothetical protein